MPTPRSNPSSIAYPVKSTPTSTNQITGKSRESIGVVLGWCVRKVCRGVITHNAPGGLISVSAWVMVQWCIVAPFHRTHSRLCTKDSVTLKEADAEIGPPGEAYCSFHAHYSITSDGAATSPRANAHHPPAAHGIRAVPDLLVEQEDEAQKQQQVDQPETHDDESTAFAVTASEMPSEVRSRPYTIQGCRPISAANRPQLIRHLRPEHGEDHDLAPAAGA